MHAAAVYSRGIVTSMSNSPHEEQGNSTPSRGEAGPLPEIDTSSLETYERRSPSDHASGSDKTLHRLLSMLFESKFALLLWGTIAGSILVPYIQRHAEERQHRLATAQSVLAQLSDYTNLSWEEWILTWLGFSAVTLIINQALMFQK